MSRNLKIREPEWSKALWLRVKSLFGGLDTRVTNIEQGVNSVTGVKGNVNLTPANIGAKGTQSAVSDPTTNGTSLSFIDSISQNAQGVIAPTKKFVKTMTGASSGSAGAGGLVPQPAAGDNAKFLKGDGTWATPSGGAVTGVKGDKESSYRTGNVNLTPANIGALPDTTTIPSKTSDLTNDGDGTSRFATMDDLTGGAGNPDIVITSAVSAMVLLGYLVGLAEKETRTFFADYASLERMVQTTVPSAINGVIGVITRNYPSANNDFSFVASNVKYGGYVYIGHFVIDATQETITATAYSIQGTLL